MIAKATVRYLRISPRKVRQVADLARDKNVNDALGLLRNMNKSAAVYLTEVLESAVSNAKRKQPDIGPQDLRITKLAVDGGPTMVRYRAASMGRAGMVRHRTSHINIELYAKEEPVKAKKQTRKRKGQK